MSDQVQRRLAAIVAADVVGYARLVGRDETGTIAALRAHRVELVAPKVAEHGGRIVKTMGDGLLMEFPSVVNATLCALEIQQAMVARNAAVDEDRRIVFRIGVNLGDIVIEGDDILGDGVNIAARLQEIAAPGGVAISNHAYVDVRDRVPAPFADHGALRLRHIARPVRVWGWRPDGACPGAAADGPRAGREGDDGAPLVLVEPFKPAGEIAVATDLAEELHSELVTTLSRRPGVKVATGADARHRARYVLSGRCRVDGGRCRLHLAMVLAETGESFWSERIEGELSNPLGFIDQAVRRIGGALRAHYNAYAGAALAARPDAELGLQELLSKAAYLFYRDDAGSAVLSRATMEAAVRLAPEDPMALAMLAWSLAQMVPFQIERVAEVDVARALALADRAVNLGPRVDYVFQCRAWLRLWLSRDPAGCLADAERALAINPDYHKALQDRALALLFGGDPRAGIEALDAVIRQVPAEPHNTFLRSMQALGHVLLGEADQAVRLTLDACERQPFVPVHALALAVAAADDPVRTGAAPFRATLARHRLAAADVRALPFARPEDIELLEDRARRAGLNG